MRIDSIQQSLAIVTRTTFATTTLALCIAGLATLSAHATPVKNFGQDLNGLKQAFNQQSVHIVQLGDSHTAGDYFTDQLRKRLQADVGDGGLGWAYPMKVKGQRVARHGYAGDGWQLSNSRFEKDVDYPLGGLSATSFGSSDYLTFTSEFYNGDTQNARFVVKGYPNQRMTVNDALGIRTLTLNQSGWQTVETPIVFPVTLRADAGLALGGAWINRPTGGVVSALGINGATQDYWQRWHTQLGADLAASRADLVILAYGTNEAFQGDVSNQPYAIKQAVSQIKHGLPNANILIVGAPESLKKTGGRCGTRAPSLDEVQTQLRQVAVEEGTLYWSWEDAMGGRCSMKNWMAQGLAAKDGVHFSRSGYERAGNDLYDGLSDLLQLSSINNSRPSYSNIGSTPAYGLTPDTPSSTTTIKRNYYLSPQARPSNSPSRGKICDSQGNCQYF